MNSNLRKVLILVLSLMMLFCGGMYGYQSYQKQQSHKIYEEAKAVASTEKPPLPPESEEEVVDPYAELFQDINLAALQEVNEDVIGWILIPDTPLSYPLMQGSDNAYYLEHTWDRQYNSAGSIFLEQHSSPEFIDFNTIIYGHRMLNDSMFGSLRYYDQLSYWSEHPYVYIYTEAGSSRYEIFAVREASVTGETYRLNLRTLKSRQAFLDTCISESVIDTGIVPTITDRILTLSTCTGRGHGTRWVIQAKRSPESSK